MQEYFNIDVDSNLKLGEPHEIQSKKGEAALLPSNYEIEENEVGLITIMTPPLRCSKVRVWPGKNNKYSKCIIDLEITENEWRFTQFLTDLSDKCRFLITENAKDWFKYTFSASSMRKSYNNIFKQKNKHNDEDKIQVQLGKLLLDDLDTQIAKSYRNHYLVLRLVFKGVLVCNGVFSEVWRADQIFKAKPSVNESDESEYDDSNYEDIGETIQIITSNTNNSDNNTSNNTQEKAIKTKAIKTGEKYNKKTKESLNVEKVIQYTSDDNKIDLFNSTKKNQEEKGDNQVDYNTKERNDDTTTSINEYSNTENHNIKEVVTDTTKTLNEDANHDVTLLEKEENSNNSIVENDGKKDEKEDTDNTKPKTIQDIQKSGKTKSKNEKSKRKKRIIISNNRRRKW